MRRTEADFKFYRSSHLLSFERIAQLCVMVMSVAACRGTAFGQGSLPNIVYILADDMGMGDVRSYTADSPVNTPNIDRIANSGMRFTDAHALDSVCSLSRYGLLTGQYGWRSRLQQGVLLPYQPPLIPAQRLTVANVLQSSGYSTGIFGKWHQGMNWVTTDGQAPSFTGSNVDHTQPFTGGPIDHGFDTYFGISGSSSEGLFGFLRDNRVVGPDLTTPCSAASPGSCPIGQARGNPSSFNNTEGPIEPDYDIHNALPTVVNEATSYIGAKANQAKPFFAYVPLTAPHEPILPPAIAVGKSGVTGPKQAYGDFIWSVDWAVGQVLDTLKDPNHDGDFTDSVLDNTLVVFTADNGVASQWGFDKSEGSINGTPLRGDKATIYEGGTRVPFVAQWAGHVPAGRVNSHLIQLNDLMSTVANITGSTLPSNAGEDSINIMPELTGTASTPVRNAGVTHSFQGVMAIRQIDSAGREWKLAFTPGDGGFNDYRKVNPLATITDFSELQLYNLSTDPGEQSNLLSSGGDQRSQQKTLQLQKVLQRYLYSGRSAPTPPRNIVNGESTMLVDFGHNSLRTDLVGWNNLSGEAYADPSLAIGLNDQAGAYTGIILKSEFVNTGSTSGVGDPAYPYAGPYPPQLAGIPTTALEDAFYVADDAQLVLTLESLDPHATYDFLFYSGAKFFMDYSLFTVTGTTVQQAHISPVVNNATQVAEITGVMADALRHIRIDVEGRRADGSMQNPSVYFDGRGQINFMRIIEHLLELPGDYNGDRTVDAADLEAWRNAYGTTGSGLAADGNHDGVVDGMDYCIWRKSMQVIAADSATAKSNSTVIGGGNLPEPTSITLVAIALASILPFRKS